MTEIPENHPRYHSLQLRHRLLHGFKTGLATESGLLAHGRGEAFDYLLGERTHDFATEAIAAASAMVRLAARPVFSVNGNTASLAAEEIVRLTSVCPKLALEVNLFYHSAERSNRIASYLQSLGAARVTESAVESAVALSSVHSTRAKMNPEGLAVADVVVVALEDGDRCQALVDAGRTVIAIDLNPLSRTAQMAHVTIVDELTRAIAMFSAQFAADDKAREESLKARIAAYDNRSVLTRAIAVIRSGN